MQIPHISPVASHWKTIFVVFIVTLGLLVTQYWHQESWTRHSYFFASSFSSSLRGLPRRPLALSSQSLPHKKKDILPGVSVSRSFTILPDTAKIVLDVDGENCESRDDFGDNVCHWNWDDSISATVHSVLEQPIQQGDYIQGHVKIDGFIPYTFRCALCGEDCSLSIPVVKANFTIPTSKHCPIPVGKHSKRLVGHLWPNSPTDGLVTTSLEATIEAIQGSTGKAMIELKLLAHVK